VLLFLALIFLGGALFFAGEYVTYPARLRERSVRRAAEYGSVRIPRSERELVHFRERVVAPAAARLASIPLKLSPRTNLETLQTRIVAAGLTQKVSVSAYLSLKGAAVVGGMLVGLSIGFIGSLAAALIFMPALGALGFLAPDWVLAMKIRGRRDTIRSELPDALDLLAVCVEAGLGFDGAINKLTEQMEGPLIDEFALTLNEIRVGETRSVALRKMAERVDAGELSNFVRAVIQADQLGISLGRILRVQAADTRNRRQAAAEEKAMKAPIKMLFPTVGFIFPAMFIVVLGPAMLNILEVFK
jgi:tight adherence protein C